MRKHLLKTMIGAALISLTLTGCGSMLPSGNSNSGNGNQNSTMMGTSILTGYGAPSKSTGNTGVKVYTFSLSGIGDIYPLVSSSFLAEVAPFSPNPNSLRIAAGEK